MARRKVHEWITELVHADQGVSLDRMVEVMLGQSVVKDEGRSRGIILLVARAMIESGELVEVVNENGSHLFTEAE